MTGIAAGVEVFAALLAAAVLVSILADRLRVPAAVLLVAAGIAVGAFVHLRPPFEFGQGILFIFLPPLIFEAAWNVDLPMLRRCAREIALLAFPGTLATAFAIAGALAWAGALPFGAALLFGAMISATDPVAVVAVFRRVGAPSDVRTIVEAESIANDGVAVVLYGAALVLALGGSVSWPASFAHGIVAVAGGIAIGAVCAAVVSWLVRTTNAAEYEVTATVALAYIAYLIADHMQLSGIFATAAGGVLLRYLQHRKDTVISNAEDADRFWNTGAYIANAIVFLSTGLAIDTSRLAHEPALIAIALVVAIGTRALLAFGVIGETRARLVVLVAGMRGALPLALALALPRTVPYRAEIIDAVFATVFVTLVVQGLPLGGFVARLYGERKRGEASTNASGDRPSTTL